ncbi:MAG: type II toxin-antitoxin system RelB/DinJ family antitoxin [Eubacterium sp.]|jgi:addiction module RelB/DinJ family antitoxin|uniref:type II toxin-antitoxin system RelB/DinJ family antitoxin n=1 Tax=Eubacterium sp. F2 TaxID=3381348 RepID=UPI003908219B|nr:type II toxin-antitoxin system RelB/DinJ family antitoxin [Eubacterium sp.]
MGKSATLNLRVDPELKQNAEAILSRLGLPMSTAVDLFLNQIVLTGGLPFAVTLPDVPENIDTAKMTSEQIHSKIFKGYSDYQAGKVHDAESAFAEFTRDHRE